MSQSDKGLVPKFNSFKAKSKPKVSDVEPQERLKINPSSRRTRGPPHRSGDKAKQFPSPTFPDKSSFHVHTSGQISPVESLAKNDREQVKRRRPEESECFIIDKRGDQGNVDFGSLHRYSISLYSPRHFSRVLGTSSTTRIDREASNDRNVIFNFGDGRRSQKPRRWLTEKFRPQDPKTIRLIVPNQNLKGLDVEDDYVDLELGRKRPQMSGRLNSSAVDLDFRSNEVSAQVSAQTDDDDSEFQSDLDDVTRPDDNGIQVRAQNAVLSRKTKEQPTDVTNWLALTEHQIRLIHGHADEAALSRHERHILADVRIAIIEKALNHFSIGSRDREELLLSLLNEGCWRWEKSELGVQWDRVLAEAESSIKLWQRFLDFKQSNALDFGFEACKEHYLRFLRMLGAEREQDTSSDPVDVGYVQVHILVRFTAFLRDAGYDELAYAIWQIVFEYQCCNPDLPGDASTTLLSLEAFWESDAPRIGEIGARGWASWVKTARPNDYRSFDQTSEEPSRCGGDADTFQQFALLESRTIGRVHLPISADQETIEDGDPFCSILFSDVLATIQTLLNVLPRNALIDGFLCYMNAPPLPYATIGHQARWHSDPFVRNHGHVPLEDNAPRPERSIDQQQTTTFYLFSHAFDGLQTQIDSLHGSGTATLRFMERVLHQLISTGPDDESLAEYLLAFKSRFFPEEIGRTAKNLLKTRPSSLRLYNAFALAEASHGRYEKAGDIWTNTLDIGTAAFEGQTSQAVLLWHSWMMTELQNFDTEHALSCLLSIPNQTRLTGSDVLANVALRLKTEQYLRQSFENMLYKKELILAVLFAECAAWLTYLADDRNVETGIQTVDKYMSRLNTASSSVIELLHQTKADIVGFHIQHGGKFKPIQIRQILAESIAAFPNNSLFHRYYIKVGMQTRVDDRLRSALAALDPQSLAKNTLVSWCYSIAQEMQRYRQTESGSTAESVRATFNRALLDPSSNISHSPLLWKSWLLFEISRAEIDRDRKPVDAISRAKRVFLDGMRHLPWNKEWVLFGMNHFQPRQEMGTSELRQLYDTMVEREMRIRINNDAKFLT